MIPTIVSEGWSVQVDSQHWLTNDGTLTPYRCERGRWNERHDALLALNAFERTSGMWPQREDSAEEIHSD